MPSRPSAADQRDPSTFYARLGSAHLVHWRRDAERGGRVGLHLWVNRLNRRSITDARCPLRPRRSFLRWPLGAHARFRDEMLACAQERKVEHGDCFSIARHVVHAGAQVRAGHGTNVGITATFVFEWYGSWRLDLQELYYSVHVSTPCVFAVAIIANYLETGCQTASLIDRYLTTSVAHVLVNSEGQAVRLSHQPHPL